MFKFLLSARLVSKFFNNLYVLLFQQDSKSNHLLSFIKCYFFSFHHSPRKYGLLFTDKDTAVLRPRELMQVLDSEFRPRPDSTATAPLGNCLVHSGYQ